MTTACRAVRSTFEEIEPWPDPVDGAELLTEIAKAIGKYVIDGSTASATLQPGAVFAYAHDLRDTAPIFYYRLADQALRQDADGKGNKRLTRKPLMASSADPAFLARAMENRPTVRSTSSTRWPRAIRPWQRRCEDN